MHFSGTVYKKTVRLLAFDHILILHCYYICIFMAIVKLGLKKKKIQNSITKTGRNILTNSNANNTKYRKILRHTVVCIP